MNSSWLKIAGGARLVVSAVAKNTADDGLIVAQRVSHHGLELSSRARQTAMASQIVWNRTVNGVNGSSRVPVDNQSADVAGTHTNPYESQMRIKNMEKQKQMNPVVESTLHQTTIKSSPEESVPNPFLLHAEPPKQRKSSLEGSAQFDSKENLVKEKPQKPQEISSSSSQSIEIPMESGPSERRSDPYLEVETKSRMQEGRAVPSSRVGRAAGFASLGMGLLWGTASELSGRLLGSGQKGNPVSSDANADRLAATLCRMRGAALKMGQMLSIQDESLLPPALTRALNQVRQGADAMPNYQLVQQMESQLGKDWRQKFETFEDLPFAAASIGQVHRATIRKEDGSARQVVVKVQYPGVANSIESDLRNLTMLVKLTGFAPRGLFLDNVIRVGRDELKVECNYINEMANQQAFQRLVASDPTLQENNFVVPNVIEELTTDQVIVSDYSPGGTIDKVKHMDQEERNRIGRAIMYLTMQELFVWRLMQTDPNWGNFLYDIGTRQTTLIDFGATREYPKEFVDGYLRIVWANANRDEQTLMKQSQKMGFLTGEENDLMLEAHKLSGFTLGEPFATVEPFDFQGSRISSRMSEHTSVFLKHRLTPPPEEVYTLHRKLAGAYMLCIRLGAVVQCRDMLENVVQNHIFEDGLPHPIHGKA